jgi:hypothetical protein
MGVHHAVAKEYLQNYLNEFCWKLNSRNLKATVLTRNVHGS